MELPNKFQFRIMKYPGFTHAAKINEWGDYEVKWARGYAQHINRVPSVTVEECWFKEYLDDGRWQIVVDKPKQKEPEAGKLPDVFCFQVPRGAIYQFTKVQPRVYNVVEYKDRDNASADRSDWPEDEIVAQLESGAWKMCDAPEEKPALTAEQERTIKSYREQITALDSSIKINKQTIHHHQPLIANYLDRQDDLHEMIAAITGEEPPKVAKAKAMKAELEKLKESV